MDLPIATDFTPTVHRKAYSSISPSRKELNQAGNTILITGGSTGIGKSIAKNFILASAATVIIVTRRADVLKESAAELEEDARNANSPSKIIACRCDVTDAVEIAALWDELKAKGITVDVLVLNAAKFTEVKPMFELGVEEVWSQMEVNVKGPLLFAERFYAQVGEGQKFLINVTTASIHMPRHPAILARPAYSLSKTSGTYAIQLLANTTPPEKIQIISFHPGMIYGAGWAASGITEDMLPFDDSDLPGAFAVWAASTEANFLHGRYVWASWDVDELAKGEARGRIGEDSDYLTLGMIGLRGTNRA